MGLNIDTENNEFLGTNDSRLAAQGKKVNLQYYTISVDSDDQTAFTIPFPYVAGDRFNLYIEDVEYQKDVDFTVVGTALTWMNSKYPLDAGQEILIKG